MIRNPPPGLPLYEALDALKEHVRGKIRNIWRRHDSISWIPFSCDMLKWNIEEAAFYGTFTPKAGFIPEPAPPPDPF